jgi:hypothetical protein
LTFSGFPPNGGALRQSRLDVSDRPQFPTPVGFLDRNQVPEKEETTRTAPKRVRFVTAHKNDFTNNFNALKISWNKLRFMFHSAYQPQQIFNFKFTNLFVRSVCKSWNSIKKLSDLSAFQNFGGCILELQVLWSIQSTTFHDLLTLIKSIFNLI